MIVIGLTGTIGAGKSTVALHLVKRGLRHYSAREFIVGEIKRRELEVTRNTMVTVANRLRELHGACHIIKSLHEEALRIGSHAVIESVRTLGELQYLRGDNNFYLIAVDALPEVRYARIIERGSHTDNISLDQFMTHESREMLSNDPARQSLSDVMAQADFRITNKGSLEDLQASVDDVLSKVLVPEAVAA